LKRFWDQASVAEQPGGLAILLDGRPMRLPTGQVLLVQHPALAEAIAEEWQLAGGAKGGEMSLAAVPLSGIAGTAQDRVFANPEASVAAIAAYGETDLLCYRATAPEALVRRQAREWQNWLDWAALELDAPLRVTSGIMHVAQDPQALAALRRAVATHDAYGLAALGVLVPLLGSLVLGLAVSAGRLDAASAHSLSCLDELFQAEFWGEDADAVARRARVGEDVALAARFLALCRERVA